MDASTDGLGEVAGRIVLGVLGEVATDGVELRFDLSAERGGEEVGNATTDEDGRFRVALEEPGSVDVRFQGRCWQGPEFEERTLALAAEALDVRPGGPPLALVAQPVVPDRALAVGVLDPDGRPVPDAEVEVTPPPA